MAEVASAFVSLVPSFKGGAGKIGEELGGPLAKAGEDGGRKFGGTFAKASAGPIKSIIGLTGPLAAGFAAVAGVHALAGFISDARESAQIGRLTAQVIQSTGGAAKITATQVGDLATAISNKTGADDEAIQSGANLLLTFTNVRNEAGKGNDVFNQATQTITDLSAALGQDTKSSAIQLGKALNDPIKGVTALSRVGVSFTAQQQEQIKTLVKSGDTLGAQKVILGELNKEFGGAAAAAADPLQKLQVIAGNAAESIGGALLPVVDSVATFLGSVIPPAVDKVSAVVGPFFDKIGAGIKLLTSGDFTGGIGKALGVEEDSALVGAILTVRDAIGQVVTSIQSFLPQISAGFQQVLPIVLAFGQSLVTTLVPVVQRLASVFVTQIVPAVLSFAQVLIANVVPVALAIGQVFIGTVLPAVSALYQYLLGKLVPIFTQVVGVITGSVIPVLSAIASFIVGQLVPAVLAIVLNIAGKLQPVFDALVSAVRTQILPAVQSLLAKFQEYLPTIEHVVSIVLKVTGVVLELAAAILGKVLPPLIKFAAFLLVNVVGAVVSVIGIVIKVIAAVVDFGAAVVGAVVKVAQFELGVAKSVGNVLRFFVELPGKILSAFGQAGSLLLGVGKDIVRGLIDGISSLAGSVTDALLALLPGPLKKFAGKLGINSPSKLFHYYGRMTGEGYVRGVDSTQGAVARSIDGLISTPTIRTPSLAGVPVGAGVGGAGVAGGSVTVPVYLDGDLIAEAVIDRTGLRQVKQMARSR